MTVPAESQSGVDVRNYGDPLGIPEARRLGADLLSSPIDNTLVGEQSSLLLDLSTYSCKSSFWFRERHGESRKI